MKKTISVLLLSITALFMACEKKNNGPSTPLTTTNTTSNGSMVMAGNSVTIIKGSCSYNNNTYLCDSAMSIIGVSGTYSNVATCGYKITAHNCFMVSQSNWLLATPQGSVSMNFEFPCSVGNYIVCDTTFSGNLCPYIKTLDSVHNCENAWTTWSSLTIADTSTYMRINVMQFGNVGQLVSGTYTGKFMVTGPDNYVYVSGKFSVIRAIDND